MPYMFTTQEKIPHTHQDSPHNLLLLGLNVAAKTKVEPVWRETLTGLSISFIIFECV